MVIAQQQKASMTTSSHPMTHNNKFTLCALPPSPLSAKVATALFSHMGKLGPAKPIPCSVQTGTMKTMQLTDVGYASHSIEWRIPAVTMAESRESS